MKPPFFTRTKDPAQMKDSNIKPSVEFKIMTSQRSANVREKLSRLAEKMMFKRSSH